MQSGNLILNASLIKSQTWRWILALALFLAGFIGLLAGTPLSERPDVVDSSILTKAYYALGFFVVGGLDVGTPVGGSWWAQTLLWIAYFGCPMLTASTVIEALFQALKPARWQLRTVQNHTIIFGSGSLAISYLEKLRQRSERGRVIVVDSKIDLVTEQELKLTYNARPVIGDLTHDYFLKQLRLRRAKRVVLLGDNDFHSVEAATRVLEIAPQLTGKMLMHCHNLRFMRSVSETKLAEQCEIFNSYNLAAQGFVHDTLIQHFGATEGKDNVVIAGFGRFGQSVLEELHYHAADRIDRIAVIDKDADRRVMVVREQDRIVGGFESEVFEGDIGHPDVWRKLIQQVDLGADQPTIILGTGQEQENLRTALWLKNRYPNAQVYARTSEISKLALALGAEHGIKSISITQLVNEHIPTGWTE